MEKTLEQQNVTYRYESKDHYLASYYRGELEFAIGQLKRQLDSLEKREKDEQFGLKIFSWMTFIAIVLMPFIFALSICGVAIPGVLGSLLFIADVGFQMYALPFCIYCASRAFVMVQINKKSRFGVWISKKWNVPIFGTEREQCKSELKRFEMFLKDIKDYEEDISLGEEVEFEPIKQRIELANIHKGVGVTNTRFGDLNRKLRLPVFLLTFLVYGLLGYIYWQCYLALYHELVYLFQQI